MLKFLIITFESKNVTSITGKILLKFKPISQQNTFYPLDESSLF